jgi:uncharacterized protein
MMLKTIGLLIASNVFMTIAWYWHLKESKYSLWLLILISWGIAFLEYCFQVPANHLGAKIWSPAQLKGLQEVISLALFSLFSIYYLNEPLHWNHYLAFLLIIAAAILLFKHR